MYASQNDGVKRQIRTHLEQAVADSAKVEHGLIALAQFDVADAIALLIAEERSMRESCETEALRTVLKKILSEGLSLSGVVPANLLFDLARLYQDVVSPDMVAAVAWALPPLQRGHDVHKLVETTLKHAPQHAGLLRVASEIAIEAGMADEAHRLLNRLGTVDKSPATINYIYRVRGKLTSMKGVGVRAALLSSFTIDTVVPYVDLHIRNLGLVPEYYVAPFNSWAQEIIDDNSQLHRFDPEISFLSVAIDDLVPELAGNSSVAFLEEKGRLVVDHVVGIVERFVSWSKSTLVVHNFHSSYRSPLGVLESRLGRTRNGWLNELNASLSERLHALARVFVLDMNEVFIHRQGGAFDNPKLRYLARMRIGEQSLNEVACAYARYVAPLKGLRRKCIVLDLDNTLWGGIVGEVGVDGVKLGDTAPGVEYQDFQRYLVSLTERGFLLAINSKNNPEDALAVIRSHEGMVLREDSFSAVRINWKPKTENIASIAEELNIGLDSMVFLDDNPNERELMKQAFPEVLTPDLPPDPSLYRSVIEGIPQLQSLVVTEEDRSRVQQYRSKRQREHVRSTTQSIEEYLQALEIVVQISQANDGALPRLHQLFERTNQFNLTTRRYASSQLREFVRDQGWRLYALKAKDRFGDHGLVGAALVRTERSESWTLDSFVMSCRVIGYGVETALLAVVTEEARSAGITTMVGEYIPTAKNAPARDFYALHGFKENETIEGVTVWTLPLNESSIGRPVWIRMEITDAT
jgi:FkbH-like protein